MRAQKQKPFSSTSIPRTFRVGSAPGSTRSGKSSKTSIPAAASNTIRFTELETRHRYAFGFEHNLLGLRATAIDAESGTKVEQRLQRLMKELGQAINESISDSEQIAEVIAKIKSGGYDVFLVLEATIGFNKREEEETKQSSLVNFRKSDPDFKVSPQDMKFLKSLRISIEHPDKPA